MAAGAASAVMSYPCWVYEKRRHGWRQVMVAGRDGLCKPAADRQYATHAVT
ncbi:MAG: hypothetical protein HYZ31_14085 [Gammaproteobacteria bacterium]|nr:hypothetical protein [Gammaproteobacteria bacterium]